MGVIHPVFRILGNKPLFINQLKNSDRCFAKQFEAFLSTITGISLAFPFSRPPLWSSPRKCARTSAVCVVHK